MVGTLRKADKLAIAAYAAPRLRGATPRRVRIVDTNGNVVRETTTTEVTAKLLERVGIEFDVTTGEPERAICSCGRVFKNDGRFERKTCDVCGGRVCVTCGKQRPPSGKPGKPGTCRDCWANRGRSSETPKCTRCGKRISPQTIVNAVKGGYLPQCVQCAVSTRRGHARKKTREQRDEE